MRLPWAWAIAEAAALTVLGVAPKTVENRGRGTRPHHVGHDWAIHAGQAWSETGGGHPRIRAAWKVWAQDRPGTSETPEPGPWAPAGAVVAVATLVDCHGVSQGRTTCCPPWGEHWHPTSYGPVSAWHLVWSCIRRLPEPVPAKGRLTVPWRLRPEVAEQVTAQLREVGA